MSNLTVRKPQQLDFTDERWAIGMRAEAVTDMNQLQTELENWSDQVNNQMIPDIEAIGVAANTAATNAESSATAASSSAAASAQSATEAANAAATAASDAAALAAADFNATVVADALADVDDIPAGGQLSANSRYYLPAGSSAIMPTATDNQWIEFVPVGNLSSNPADVTFGVPVQDSSGTQLAAGTHNYNKSETTKLTLKSGVWRF